jgi:hypothetical protein
MRWVRGVVLSTLIRCIRPGDSAGRGQGKAEDLDSVGGQAPTLTLPLALACSYFFCLKNMLSFNIP